MSAILVAYECEGVREQIAGVLRVAGYQVVESAPAEAGALVQARGEVAMVVTDYVPPTIMRPELAAKLAGSAPELRILLAPGSDGPLSVATLAASPESSQRLVAAVASLFGADDPWGFCAL